MLTVNFFLVPKEVGFSAPPLNPALPPKKAVSVPSRLKAPTGVTETAGHGPNRVYIDIEADQSNIAYPPRPIPGSVADLDVIMEHCDFGSGKVGVLFNTASGVKTDRSCSTCVTV